MKINFDEERARLILQYAYPEKYKNLIHRESPDIKNKSGTIGVEITSSANYKFNEQMARASDITGKRTEDLSEYNKENIIKERLYAERIYDNQWVAGFTMWGETHSIREIYIKKLNKLNTKNFEKFNENNLFIFSWFIDSDELDIGISEIINTTISKYALVFDIVYIFTGDTLIKVNVSLKKIDKRFLSKDIITDISNRAKKNIDRGKVYGK